MTPMTHDAEDKSTEYFIFRKDVSVGVFETFNLFPIYCVYNLYFYGKENLYFMDVQLSLKLTD